MHATDYASIIICLSGVLSRLFIYLLAYLFICVFIIRRAGFLFICQLGSEGRAGEHSSSDESSH